MRFRRQISVDSMTFLYFEPVAKYQENYYLSIMQRQSERKRVGGCTSSWTTISLNESGTKEPDI